MIAPLAVLRPTTGHFEAGVNPFEYLPFHLLGLLRPALRVTGASESHDWTCVVTDYPTERRAGPDLTLSSYPGPGLTGVRSQETELYEYPYSPGDLLGYPPLSPTGPHVYLFAHGPRAANVGRTRILSARLTGPSGDVPLKWVDAATPKVMLSPQAAIVVAPDPVPPGAYCMSAKVRFERFPDAVIHRVPFTTKDAPAGARPPSGCVPLRPAKMRVDKVRLSGRKLVVRVSAAKAARGRFVVSATTGPKPDKLRQSGAVRTVRGRKVATFSGTLKPAPGARWTIVDVRFRRTDGGPGSADGRTIKAPR
jgi:hypothetical protein